jgi:hypothetical protein
VSGPEPHPEALIRDALSRLMIPDYEASAALDVLVGRLEQKDKALRWFASEDAWDVPTTILTDGRFGFNPPPGSVYSTPWGVAREALGVPPQPQDSGASRAGRSGEGAA